MRQGLACGVFVLLVLGIARTSRAQLKMVAIASSEILDAADPGFFDSTNTIWNVDFDGASPGSSTLIRQLDFIPRTKTVEWNPLENALYRASGISSRSNDPLNDDYRDNQYLEAVDVYDYGTSDINNSGAVTVLFAANPPPADAPPDDAIPVFGSAGPAPTWLLPSPRRTVAQSDPSFRSTPGVGIGPNEYNKARGVAWSVKDKAAYVISDNGLFKYTRDGDHPAGHSALVGVVNDDPDTTGRNEASDVKDGVFFHPSPGETQFLVSMRDDAGLGDGSEPDLYQMNPATAQFDFSTGLNIRLLDGGGNFVRNALGFVALAQNPDTQVLYGATKGIEDVAFRQLVRFETFDANGTLTGNATIIGQNGLGSGTPGTINGRWSGMTFVGYATGDMDRDDGGVDFDDISRFVQGLTDPAGYLADMGVRSRVSGDMDGDGDQDFDDIPGFVNLLQGNLGAAQSVPEPSSVLLAGAALIGLFGYRRRRRRV